MTTAAALEGCVASLDTSRQLLDSSIAILDSGVRDLPRLSKVLQTTRHFELVSAHSLQQAQAALLAEIEPEVASLLNRVSVHLDRLERREQSLIAKCDLNEGRLSHERERARGSTPKPTSDDLRPEAIPVEEIKIQRLRQKKERLSYAVDRLTLQAHQRERQLRMSMAAPQQYGLD